MLLVNQNSLFDRLAKSGEGRTIALVFLAGVALQVLVAEALWLELSIDVLTLIAFSTATAIVLWNLAPAAR